MSQAVAERAGSRPTYLTDGNLRREVYALDRYPNPVPILTQTVHREHIQGVLNSAGICEEDPLVLNRVVDKPFIWHVHSGTISAPEFPKGGKDISALVAVSEVAYSDDKNRVPKRPARS